MAVSGTILVLYQVTHHDMAVPGTILVLYQETNHYMAVPGTILPTKSNHKEIHAKRAAGGKYTLGAKIIIIKA